jgi:hypothetical protein
MTSTAGEDKRRGVSGEAISVTLIRAFFELARHRIARARGYPRHRRPGAAASWRDSASAGGDLHTFRHGVSDMFVCDDANHLATRGPTDHLPTGHFRVRQRANTGGGYAVRRNLRVRLCCSGHAAFADQRDAIRSANSTAICAGKSPTATRITCRIKRRAAVGPQSKAPYLQSFDPLRRKTKTLPRVCLNSMISLTESER